MLLRKIHHSLSTLVFLSLLPPSLCVRKPLFPPSSTATATNCIIAQGPFLRLYESDQQNALNALYCTVSLSAE